jgi:hypothetical protein
MSEPGVDVVEVEAVGLTVDFRAPRHGERGATNGVDIDWISERFRIIASKSGVR